MSIYWAFNTMMNVSINILPKTDIEIAFSSLCMLLSCFTFGYLVNTIRQIIKKINKKSELYQ